MTNVFGPPALPLTPERRARRDEREAPITGKQLGRLCRLLQEAGCAPPAVGRVADRLAREHGYYAASQIPRQSYDGVCRTIEHYRGTWRDFEARPPLGRTWLGWDEGGSSLYEDDWKAAWLYALYDTASLLASLDVVPTAITHPDAFDPDDRAAMSCQQRAVLRELRHRLRDA